MIELPEATVLAAQIDAHVRGRRVVSAVFGQTPMKWAFSTRKPEDYAQLLPGKVIGNAWGNGSMIHVAAEPGYELVLGGGGERVLLHADGSTVPRKHQLLLAFDDGSCFTVSVQGWGSVHLFAAGQTNNAWCGAGKGPAALDEAFSLAHFLGLFDVLAPGAKASVKYFLITKPGVWGLGNGYLQDVLFRARIHPRMPAASLTGAQRRTLYKAIVSTLREAVRKGGRTDEYDLFGRPGRYARVLDAKAAGQPCGRCGQSIVKEQYLGGSVYFCPQCQVPPAVVPGRAKAKQMPKTP